MDFKSLNLPICDIVSSYPENVQSSIFRYLSSLSPLQRVAYTIAKDHLGTSFDVVRSTGYIDWVKKGI